VVDVAIAPMRRAGRARGTRPLPSGERRARGSLLPAIVGFGSTIRARSVGEYTGPREASAARATIVRAAATARHIGTFRTREMIQPPSPDFNNASGSHPEAQYQLLSVEGVPPG
jgi:hypothetical protein